MPKIFISYRRADSRKDAGRIYDQLVDAFGKDNIFKDVDNIPFGRDFRGVLSEAVNDCDVLLAVIGQNWLTISDEEGNRRLDNPADFVRIEIQSALQRGDWRCLVIPVLVDSAAMAGADKLPLELRELAFKNAITVRDDPDFHRDMERLVRQLQRYDEELEQRRAAEKAERQQAEIEAQAKAQAEALERKQLADEQARLKAVADEQERQRKAELKAAKRERQREPAATTFSQPAPESFQPEPLPEPETYSPSAPTPPRWRRFLKPRRLLVAAGFTALVIAGAVIIPVIQKSIFVGDTRTISIARNADWTPVEQDVNGVPMVQVPAGCFDMGSTSGNSDELPLTRLCFEQEFWLDKTEVTNAQFSQFNGKAEKASNWTDPNRPRENITWFEARDFCALRGGRLPTEAEWEYAARGPDNLVYPWGNDFDGDKVVYSINSNNQTADVASKPAGVSWVGALDMSGNVWEWVATVYQPYPYPTPGSSTELEQWINSNDTSNSRILRGGAWGSSATTDLRAADRFGDGPYYGFGYLGFRCVVSAPS